MYRPSIGWTLNSIKAIQLASNQNKLPSNRILMICLQHSIQSNPTHLRYTNSPNTIQQIWAGPRWRCNKARHRGWVHSTPVVFCSCGSLRWAQGDGMGNGLCCQLVVHVLTLTQSHSSRPYVIFFKGGATPIFSFLSGAACVFSTKSSMSCLALLLDQQV